MLLHRMMWARGIVASKAADSTDDSAHENDDAGLSLRLQLTVWNSCAPQSDGIDPDRPGSTSENVSYLTTRARLDSPLLMWQQVGDGAC